MFSSSFEEGFPIPALTIKHLEVITFTSSEQMKNNNNKKKNPDSGNQYLFLTTSENKNKSTGRRIQNSGVKSKIWSAENKAI